MRNDETYSHEGEHMLAPAQSFLEPGGQWHLVLSGSHWGLGRKHSAHPVRVGFLAASLPSKVGKTAWLHEHGWGRLALRKPEIHLSQRREPPKRFSPFFRAQSESPAQGLRYYLHHFRFS